MTEMTNVTQGSASYNYGKSKEEIWKRLLEGKKTKQMEREHAKSVFDQMKFQEECSFHPSINQNSKAITERSQHGAERVEDKLYRAAFDKQKVIEKLRQASEAEMMKDYTFKPEIPERPNQPTTERISIQDRYRDIQVFKEKMIADLRKKFLNDEELTFKPKISSKTERYALTKVGGRPLLDRLQEEGSDIRERKRILEFQAFQKEAEECPFRPETNAGENIHILKNSENRAEYEEDFLTRQEIYSNNRDRNRIELTQKIKKEQFPFRPAVNEMSRGILEADPEYHELSLEDKIRRLAIVDKERLECKLRRLQEEEDRRYPYKPQIDPNSKLLAKSKNLTDLADVTERQKRLNEKKKEAEEERMRECRFKPDLSMTSNYKRVESAYSEKNYSKKMEEQFEKKRLEAESLRKQSEFEQLKECTFKPDTSKAKRSLSKVPIGSVDTIVRGMENVYRNKDMQEKKKRDLLLREKEVFDFASRYDERQRQHETHTVPVPFNLSKKPRKFREQVALSQQKKKTGTKVSKEKRIKENVRKFLAMD